MCGVWDEVCRDHGVQASQKGGNLSIFRGFFHYRKVFRQIFLGC